MLKSPPGRTKRGSICLTKSPQNIYVDKLLGREEARTGKALC